MSDLTSQVHALLASDPELYSVCKALYSDLSDEELVQEIAKLVPYDEKKHTRARNGQFSAKFKHDLKRSGQIAGGSFGGGYALASVAGNPFLARGGEKVHRHQMYSELGLHDPYTDEEKVPTNSEVEAEVNSTRRQHQTRISGGKPGVHEPTDIGHDIGPKVSAGERNEQAWKEAKTYLKDAKRLDRTGKAGFGLMVGGLAASAGSEAYLRHKHGAEYERWRKMSPKQRRAALKKNLEDELIEVAKTDPLRLKRALDNLQSSADAAKEAADLKLSKDKKQKVTKRGLLTDEEQAKRERTEARVGLASNALGITAGAAALGAATQHEGFAHPDAPAWAKKVAAVGEKIPTPLRDAAIKRPKLAAGMAVGAVGLQAANLAGDVVANRVLNRAAKNPDQNKNLAKNFVETVNRMHELGLIDDDGNFRSGA